MWLQTLKLGIKSLLLHKLRSLLTMLGVILGVGSVIAMLAIGEGSKREALERIRRLGATNVIIRSIKPGQQGGEEEEEVGGDESSSPVVEFGLQYKDLERLKGTLSTIHRAVPITLIRKRAQAMHRGIPNARILGTTSECSRRGNRWPGFQQGHLHSVVHRPQSIRHTANHRKVCQKDL